MLTHGKKVLTHGKKVLTHGKKVLTHGKKCFMYEGAKFRKSISDGIKTTETISEFKTLLKNGMELLAYVKIVSFAP